MSLRNSALVAAAVVALGGCSTGQTTTPSVTSVNPIAGSKLQLAVGTANINGSHGLNVVATLRQSNGTSILYDTPTLSGPFTFGTLVPFATSATSATGASLSHNGPSTAEAAALTIGSTAPSLTIPPNQAGGLVSTAAGTTFGINGGLAATGFSLSNSTVNGILNTGCAIICGPDDVANANNGAISSYTTVDPFVQPFYPTGAAAAASFTPWLGPPAFAGPNGLGSRDGTYASGINGAAIGLSVFNGVVAGGATPYTLSVVIPTGFNGNTPTTGTLTATATLPTPGFFIGGGAAIAVPALTFPGNGSATGTYALPAGATGAIIQIVDLGSDGAGAANCYPAQLPTIAGNFQVPAFYSVVTTGGAFTLPGNIGPRQANSTTTTPTICSAAQNTAALGTATPGDTVRVSVIAYDYGLLALVPALSGGVQAPAIPAQADIALSAAALQVSP